MGKFYTLKALLHTNVLNDVTAAPFLVSFSQLPAAKKHRNGAAVTSLRTFVRSSAFHKVIQSLGNSLVVYINGDTYVPQQLTRID